MSLQHFTNTIRDWILIAAVWLQSRDRTESDYTGTKHNHQGPVLMGNRGKECHHSLNSQWLTWNIFSYGGIETITFSRNILAMFDMYRHFLLMFSSLWPVFRLLYGLNSESLARQPGLTPHSTGPKLTWMAQKLVNWWHLYLEVSPAVLMNTNGALCRAVLRLS